MSKTVVLKPRISEKAYEQSLAKNVYVFEVPVDLNKHQVADAVASHFDVTVTDVNILNVKGKVKRTVRRGGRSVTGSRADFRKAYVTVKAGDSIAIFANEEDSKKKDAETTAKKTRTKKGAK